MANVNVNGDAQTIYGSIQILLDQDEERRNHHNQVSPSIYKVHSMLRDLSPTSFNPRVVAIGPLHKQDEKLEAIEGHKVTYMFHLFQRLNTTPLNQILSECVQRVHGEIGRIRACYVGKMNSYDDVQVAKMMVIDGCFLLEFILRRVVDSLKPKDDPIFDNTLLVEGVALDLILIENQIPFIVLQHIFNCIIPNILRLSLTNLILLFLKDINPFDPPFNTNNDGADINYDHILDLLQKSCWPANAQSSRFSVSRFRSAVDLSRAGVNFKRNQDVRKWLLAMEFKSCWLPCFFWSWGKPTLRMPALTIDDRTELIMRNLIAYEQCSPLIHTYITSYAVALDMLVDTEQDVLLLVESEVLTNHLGSNQDAANMINSICKEITVKGFYYDEQWRNLYNFYNSYWPRNIASVRRNYFNSPWNFIALLAAIILFALTIVQTYFTIRAA